MMDLIRYRLFALRAWTSFAFRHPLRWIKCFWPFREKIESVEMEEIMDARDWQQGKVPNE